MKNIKFFAVALMCMMVSTVCNADDRMVPVSQLPAAAKTFVQQNYKGKSIVYVEFDREFNGGKYEVTLNDGTQIDFDKKGVWDKIDCEAGAVPAALIPGTIANYVKTNFAGAKVTKIDKERYGYEIELSNGLELKFNKAGQLLSMDD